MLEACPQGDRAAQARADKVGGRGVERVDDREGVGDVLIPAVQRRVGTTRCSISSNIRHRNAITAGKSVGKRSHAVIGPTAVQHDDQLAAADDLAHERPAVIPDVQRSHHQLPLPMSALSGIPQPDERLCVLASPESHPCNIPMGGIQCCTRIPGRGIPREDGSSVMSTITYAVTGMTCGHCELSVREEVSEVAGVEEVEVSATTGALIVTSSGLVDDAQILHAVGEAGYSAVRVA